MENNTSPQHGGDIPKKDRSPISMLKIYTPGAASESQYPPATEQPEDECVVDLRAHSFESVCQVVTENQVLQARLSSSERRVKALEEALLKIRDVACYERGNAMELKDIAEEALEATR